MSFDGAIMVSRVRELSLGCACEGDGFVGLCHLRNANTPRAGGKRLGAMSGEQGEQHGTAGVKMTVTDRNNARIR